jgi:hypothetical protein
MGAYPIMPVVLGATHVLPAEVTLVDLVTNDYRRVFGKGAGIVLEEIADPTNCWLMSRPGARGSGSLIALT